MTTQCIRHRMPNRRAIQRAVVAIVAAVVTLIVFTPAVHAGPGRPVAGRDYVRQGSGDGSNIRVWIKSNAHIYAPGLAEVFRTTVKDIRRLNPDFTVALCYDPKLGKAVQSNNVTSDPKTRATNEVWEGCAEENRWIYVFPGSLITLPDPMSKIMEERLAAEDKAPPPKSPPEESPAKEQTAPAPAAPTPATPAAAPPASSAVARQPNDEEVHELEQTLRTERGKTKGLKEKNGELRRLAGEAEQRLAAFEDLLIEKNGEIAKLQASIIPPGARFLFVSALFVLVAGLLFVGFRLRASRTEIANLRAAAASANETANRRTDEADRLSANLHQANEALSAAESRCRDLASRLERSERRSTERSARIVEMESVENRLNANLEKRGVREEAFRGEVERLRQVNVTLSGEVDRSQGVIMGLKADVERLKGKVDTLRQRLNDSYLEEIREGALEEEARAVSELPGPTKGDHELRDLASQFAVADSKDAEAYEEEEEPCPETRVGGAPPPADLPINPNRARQVRIPTLPQAIGHVADLLLPESRERITFFEAADTISEVARAAGRLTVVSEEEIMVLGRLANMWFEVYDPREGKKPTPVRIQDFAAEANQSAFQPVST